MEYIKRKILKEDLISRRPDFTYGEITAETINFKVQLTQTFNDMGMFTDMAYANESPDHSILIDKLSESGLTFDFYSNPTNVSTNISHFTDHLRLNDTKLNDYFGSSGVINGSTDSKINEVKSYDINNPYIVGFNVDSGTYVDINGKTIQNTDEVVKLISSFTGYTLDANKNDPNLGTSAQTHGILYKDFNNGNTEFSFSGQGYNITNSSLSAITKQEYLMNVTSEPKVFNDVFIDRGVANPIEAHMRLSEIVTLDQMEEYNGGYYDLGRF